ncbi:MAG: indole-3-glycerol phosphate synthase [Candidatus Epulonipiscioides saccharophilum]|nr:MAG: indole-3-glycerol phosphate synthase [Epulopiscium sp. AS2M-Bin001]
MILDKILASTKIRIEEEKKQISEASMKTLAISVADRRSFKDAIFRPTKSDPINFICEVKKASPSKGVIVPDFDYKKIAKDYSQAGASAISVLTEPEYFLGSSEYLAEISKIVSTPLLKKDFIIDSYQIYQAKAIGASAILLICSALSDKKLKKYLELAKSLGLDALVETHDKEEVQRALSVGAEIIGVNNRDLKTFDVDINTSIYLRELVPIDKVFVAESGIKTRADIIRLEQANVDAVLIGETLVRESDKKAILNQLKGQV